ncbi:uncharacterized protein BX664DRAFT_334388 [Halteromyces radiatus]|uniref:uncharacterized protein n=1 Tax=Halteromyces radiatus TaxID=101107 RepID=UPI00221E455F|nr:uncharacterized protein BX664DRAFT_334388 [Halteromyces radiatus]KAI8089988.1 hypothetical protein BX664DRAFT_334388 [Halteromyces radiatus]
MNYIIVFLIVYFLMLVNAMDTTLPWSPSDNLQSVLPSALPSPSPKASGVQGLLGDFGKAKLGYDAYKVAKTQVEHAKSAIHH